MSSNILDEDNEISEINMTPFVDIVLVVLIIFMATATFIAQNSIKLELPKASKQPLINEESKPIEISILQDGTIYFNSKIVDANELDIMLAQNELKTKGVILKCDSKTEFDKVVLVIDLAKKNSLDKFLIQTQINAKPN